MEKMKVLDTMMVTDKLMFSAYDIKARRYSAPFLMYHRDEAKRSFKTVVNDKTTVYGQHPEDFNLQLVGMFDERTGEIMPLQNPEIIANGLDFVSNGFKVRSTNDGVNRNGDTIIYAAFAENPFKYANAR